MLAGLDGGGGDDRVRMVRGGDHDGICLGKQFVEHHAPVLVALRVRIALEDVRGIFPVHVAEADDLLGLQAPEDAGAATADAHAENLQFAVQGGRSFVPTLGEHLAGHHRKADGRGRTGPQEVSSRNVFSHKNESVF